jgi:flagellar hook protein FlgE
MFDTIFIGTSGLLGYAKGLRVVGNNLANVNTPGFKSSQVLFSELFDQGVALGHGSGHASSTALGTGLDSLGSKLNFSAGVDQSTGNPLDLQINGNGFYVIKRDGALLYTRSGDFRFNDGGVLVNSNGDHVQALDGSGQLGDVTLDNFARCMPKASSTVKLTGNVSSTVAVPPVNSTLAGVTVLDPTGASHTLKLTFQNNGGGDFTVSVNEGTGPVLATGSIKFSSGFPIAGSNAITFDYAPAGSTSFSLKLDFSTNVTSLSGSSSIAVASVDGFAAGVRSDQSIDADGTLRVFYSNGQQDKGPRLALANFNSDEDLVEAGGSAFQKTDAAVVQYGSPSDSNFGKLVAGHREGSNVDLAEEFSNLILMQRGYQASSHVISTANDMIQELFDMKGHR